MPLLRSPFREVVGYRNHQKHPGGFTLIEVLVSLVILSVGLLGIFAMQSKALMDNQDAYLRTQAIFLAYDMGDRIRANPVHWESAVINDTLGTIVDNASAFTSADHPFCNTYDPIAADKLGTQPNTCTTQQMAEYDTYRWMTDANVILPDTIKPDADTDAPPTMSISRVADPNVDPDVSPNSWVIRLTLSWARVNPDIQANLGGNATYSLDVRL